MLVRKCHVEHYGILRSRDGDCGIFPVPEFKGYLRPFGKGAFHFHFHTHFRCIDVGGEVQAADVLRSAGFQIDGLPDTAGVTVSLLAIEVGIRRSVIRLYGDGILTSEVHCIGKFEFERNIAAAVAAEFAAVDGSGGHPVRGPYNHEYPLSLPRSGDVYFPRVPGDIACVFYTGQFGSPGEGNIYLEVVIPFRRLALVEGEVPGAVQVYEPGTFEVGPGMLGERDVRGCPV